MSLPEASQIDAILLDIEGTTTPIDFVTKVLFPYASRKLESFLRRKIDDPGIRSCLEAFREQRAQDVKAGLDVPAWPQDSAESEIAGATAYGRWLMSRDSKLAALKTLQGMIWLEGYRMGVLKGEVYRDVPPALVRWRGQGKRIYIYSSGSILAQRLLFGSTAFGDLTKYLDGFFDTKVGAKSDTSSYREITKQAGVAADRVLFLSDVTKELAAAMSAGMHVALVVRVIGEPPSSDFEVVPSFESLFP